MRARLKAYLVGRLAEACAADRYAPWWVMVAWKSLRSLLKGA